MPLEGAPYVVPIQVIAIDTQWEFSYVYPIKKDLEAEYDEK